MARVASVSRSLVLVFLVTLAAGCAGQDESEQLFAEVALPRLVLQPEDLASQWSRFDEGRQLRADAPSGVRGDATRFDRQDGWKARYRRPGSPDTRGALVVESRADLFAAVSGAEQDFDAAIEDLDRSGGSSRPVETIELGDEARALGTGSGEEGQLSTVTIVWRVQNLVAALTANGFAGKLETADVLVLARKQQARIERARS